MVIGLFSFLQALQNHHEKGGLVDGKRNYPEAWERFVKREDHMDFLKKYHAYCQGEMKLFMEALKIACNLRGCNDLEPGVQQDYYDWVVYETELKTMCRLVDLLAEASWMSE